MILGAKRAAFTPSGGGFLPPQFINYANKAVGPRPIRTVGVYSHRNLSIMPTKWMDQGPSVRWGFPPTAIHQLCQQSGWTKAHPYEEYNPSGGGYGCWKRSEQCLFRTVGVYSHRNNQSQGFPRQAWGPHLLNINLKTKELSLFMTVLSYAQLGAKESNLYIQIQSLLSCH